MIRLRNETFAACETFRLNNRNSFSACLLCREAPFRTNCAGIANNVTYVMLNEFIAERQGVHAVRRGRGRRDQPDGAAGRRHGGAPIESSR